MRVRQMERQLREKDAVITDMQRQLEQLEREGHRLRSPAVRPVDDCYDPPEKGPLSCPLGDYNEFT